MPTRPSAEPRKVPRQRRSAETVARILDAAARIFEEDGYRATTTNHVAHEAGVSIGSLYQYFPNKDALLVALADRHLDEVVDRFGERLASLRRDSPPAEEVVRSLVGLTVGLNDTSQLHALLFSDCPRTPALEERLERFTELLVGEVALHLERTGCGGADPVLRSRLVVAAVDSAVHEVVLVLPPGPDRRRAVDEVVLLVTGGIGASVRRRARGQDRSADAAARRPKKVPSPSEMPEQ